MAEPDHRGWQFLTNGLRSKAVSCKFNAERMFSQFVRNSKWPPERTHPAPARCLTLADRHRRKVRTLQKYGRRSSQGHENPVTATFSALSHEPHPLPLLYFFTFFCFFLAQKHHLNGPIQNLESRIPTRLRSSPLGRRRATTQLPRANVQLSD